MKHRLRSTVLMGTALLALTSCASMYAGFERTAVDSVAEILEEAGLTEEDFLDDGMFHEGEDNEEGNWTILDDDETYEGSNADAENGADESGIIGSQVGRLDVGTGNSMFPDSTVDLNALAPESLTAVSPNMNASEWDSVDTSWQNDNGSQTAKATIETEINPETAEEVPVEVTGKPSSTIVSEGVDSWDMLSEYDKFLADLGDDFEMPESTTSGMYQKEEESEEEPFEGMIGELDDNSDNPFETGDTDGWETVSVDKQEEEETVVDTPEQEEPEAQAEPEKTGFWHSVGEFFRNIGRGIANFFKNIWTSITGWFKH